MLGRYGTYPFYNTWEHNYFCAVAGAFWATVVYAWHSSHYCMYVHYRVNTAMNSHVQFVRMCITTMLSSLCIVHCLISLCVCVCVCVCAGTEQGSWVCAHRQTHLDQCCQVRGGSRQVWHGAQNHRQRLAHLITLLVYTYSVRCLYFMQVSWIL